MKYAPPTQNCPSGYRVDYARLQAHRAEQRMLRWFEDDYFGWYFVRYASLEVQHEIFFRCLEGGAE